MGSSTHRRTWFEDPLLNLSLHVFIRSPEKQTNGKDRFISQYCGSSDFYFIFPFYCISNCFFFFSIFGGWIGSGLFCLVRSWFVIIWRSSNGFYGLCDSLWMWSICGSNSELVSQTIQKAFSLLPLLALITFWLDKM